MEATALRTEARRTDATDPCTVEQLACNDVDELRERLPRTFNAEFAQLRPGFFTARMTIIRLGHTLVMCGHYDQSLLQKIGPPGDSLTINRPGRGSDPLVFGGRPVERAECFVSGQGGSYEGVNLGALYPTTFSINRRRWEDQSYWLENASWSATRGTRLQLAGPEWTSAFLDAMEWIVDAVKQYPRAVASAPVCASLADSLLARINALGAPPTGTARARQAAAHRRAAVDHAREYIDQHLASPIRLSDLCRHTGMQARSLEYAFRSIVGVSPIHYIRSARLHHAHRMLRSDAVRTRSVSEIALDSGFWHLSQFSVDYKQMFGQSPSVTYRQTRTRLPNAARQRRVGA